MPGPSYRRSSSFLQTACLATFLLALPASAQTPDDSATPVSVPAGALQARPATKTKAKPATVSAHQAREADDAYLEGAKQLERDDIVSAERSFAHAVELNPNKQEYILSLTVAREHHLTELVQQAAKARLITQHDGVDASSLSSFLDQENLRAQTPSFDGPIELDVTPGVKSFHLRNGAQDVIRAVYLAYGITVTFDESVTNNAPIKFDLDDVDFKTATRVVADMTHIFAVAVQPHSALVAKDTTENRERLETLVEETVYLPGLSSDAITEMANVARNIFELKQVTASPTGGDILIRGDEPTLRALNATYADMLDGGSDVLLDIHMYELDKTHLQNIGASTPSSIGIFPIVSTAENLINSNQSLLSQAISAGILKLSGTTGQQQLEELAFLIASGTASSSEFTNLLGVFGTYGGLPLAGLYLGSSGTFNLLLNSSDVRTLDDVQIRASDNQPVNFRSGTRYPIVTATYSSGVSSSLASSLAGVNINGTSAASLLAQYGGASSVSVPQVQYEDLGITVKATPKIQRSGDVSVALDMKIEALAGGTIDSIPILNNRAYTSTISIPRGQTAMLAGVVSRNEARDIEGVPYLSELPGFQGTDKSTEIDSSELLITITPHVVRTGRLRITSRRIPIDHASRTAE